MKTPKPKLVFVGQGPNQASWERGLQSGKFFAKTQTAEQYAVGYCERIALTGAVGTKLAQLLDLDEVGDFFRKYQRRNLNPKWNGKRGRGDVFDRDDGTKAANALRPDFDKFVLLGREVAACFDCDAVEPLARAVFYDEADCSKEFLLFPHLSGLNPWWNDAYNAARARVVLREFVLGQ